MALRSDSGLSTRHLARHGPPGGWHDPLVAAMAAVACATWATMVAGRPRNWASLSAGAKRRWVAAFGGPRSLPPADRARRAQRYYEAGEPLPAEHSGHLPAPETRWSAVPTTQGVQPVVAASRVEGRRVGEYSADVRRLLEGELDPADFRRRWSRRVRQAGDFELEADPNRVQVLFAASGPPAQPFYSRRRQAPRTRAA